MHHAIEQRKQRWTDLLENSGSGQRFVFVIRYRDPDAPQAPKFWPDKKRERIEWAWQLYNYQCARSEWLADDQIPYLNMVTGTEIFAEALGCQVYRPDDNMPFAIPFVHSAAEAARVKIPRLEDSSLAILFEMADELARRAGPGVLLKMVDIQSPMDIVAQMWEKTDLFVAMVQAPDAVRELAAQAQALLTAFLDEWFRRYGPAHIAHHPDFYVRRGMTLSADEIGSVNKGMFQAFFKDELDALSDRYGSISIHCCANARHQWQNLRAVHNLRLLNLAQPPEVIDQAYRFFGPRVSHMHYELINGTTRPLAIHPPEHYPADCRIVLQVEAATKDQALAWSEKLWHEYHANA
jgi:hypothetical protein